MLNIESFLPPHLQLAFSFSLLIFSWFLLVFSGFYMVEAMKVHKHKEKSISKPYAMLRG
jgi:hypothetical protein